MYKVQVHNVPVFTPSLYLKAQEYFEHLKTSFILVVQFLMLYLINKQSLGRGGVKIRPVKRRPLLEYPLNCLFCTHGRLLYCSKKLDHTLTDSRMTKLPLSVNKRGLSGYSSPSQFSAEGKICRPISILAWIRMGLTLLLMCKDR